MINDFEIKNGKLYAYKGKENCVVIPDGVKHIKFGTFFNNWDIETVIIPNSVKELGYGTFLGCKNLKSVVLSNSIKALRDDTFKWCENLISIIIPDGVTNIGGNAFYGCKSLENISIPQSVTNIGLYAFYGCIGLQTYSNRYFKITDDNMLGKTFNAEKAELCAYGFHACRSPLDVFNSYDLITGKGARLYEVSLKGVLKENDTKQDVFTFIKKDSKCVGTEITFLRELTISELAELASKN